MDGKKIFGIGAVVLLLFLAITPLVNSMNIKTNEFINNIEGYEKVTNNLNCDLEIILNYCILGSSQPLLPHDWYKPTNSYYVIYYTIKNHGNFYSGDVRLTFTTLEMKENTVIWSWVKTINLDNSESIDLTYKSSKIVSHWDPNIDEERYIAGKFVSLELEPLNADDLFMDNNVDYGSVKFWKDNAEYSPTEPQLLVGAAHSYMNISIPGTDLWYYNFPFEEDTIPIVTKNRLGYVWELTIFIHKINKIVREMCRDFVDLIILVKDDIKIILYWIENLLFWITAIVNGYPIPGALLELLINYFNYVRPALDRIKDEVYEWLIFELIELVDKLIEIHDKFEQWKDSEPWKLPITVEITVLAKNKNDDILLKCREQSDTGSGKKIHHFTFNVPSKINDEKYYFTPKDCTVKVVSYPKGETRHTPKIFSYAFANGTLRYINPISFPINSDVKSIFLKGSLLERFLNSGKNIKYFFNKLININSLKNTNNHLTRRETISENKNLNNFDLDALVNQVLDEQKQYEKYDVEYKKYYPGAPKDPNVAYYSSDQVIVAFKSYVDITNMDEVEGYPVVDKLLELNTVIVEIYAIEPEDFIDLVQQREDVEYAELNFVYQTCFIPNDPYWDDQWNMRAINCPQAWDIQKGKFTTKIAIIDTGVWYNHEDSNNWASLGYDFVNNDDDPTDDCYVAHGTHCAGIATAQMNNGIGIAGVSDCSITPIKVLDSQGAGYASDIAKGIIYATDNCIVNVISMSLGGYGISVLLHVACDFAYYIRDTLIVAAAGNDGLSRLCYPARFNSVVSVGAVDKNLKLCSWSNHGRDLDLVAPGEGILSTVRNNKYTKLSGTSMATPHVAGVAALYYSSKPFDKASVCKGALFSSAINIGVDCKYGLVNAYDTVKTKNTDINLIPKNFPLFWNFLETLKFL